jgi:hypothetical protein
VKEQFQLKEEDRKKEQGNNDAMESDENKIQEKERT